MTKIVSNEPIKLQEPPRKELPFTKRSVNTARKNDTIYNKNSKPSQSQEDNIALKMLSKQDQDFSDVSNVKIKATKEKETDNHKKSCEQKEILVLFHRTLVTIRQLKMLLQN